MHHYRSPDSDPVAASKSKSSSGSGEDVMEVLGQLEAQLTKLRSMQKDQDSAVAALSSRSSAVKDAEAQLQKSRAEFESQRRQLEAERASLASQGETLRKKQSELELKSAEIDRKLEEFEAERKRVETLDRQSQKQQKEIAERAAKLEAERTEMVERVAQAEKNVGDLIKQVETIGEELNEKNKELKRSGAETARLHKKINQLEQAVEQAQSSTVANDEVVREANERTAQLEKTLENEIKQRDEQIAESRRKLDQTTKKLTEFASILNEQTPQLERGAAAIAMVEQQHEQIERLTKQLAERALGSDPEELRRRDERIAELTEALRQARGQSGGEQDLSNLEQRNAELLSQIDAMKVEVESAHLAAKQAEQQLQQMANAQASAEAQDGHGDAATIHDLRWRIQELESQLAAAPESSGVNGHSDEVSYSQALREKAERVSIVADHLRRRRARLLRMRQLIRQRIQRGATPVEQFSGDERIRMERERIQLGEVRKMLELSERQMVRRWARSRAAIAVGSLAFVTLLCAVLAWFTADYVWPARVSATVALEAKGRESGKIPKDALASWTQWHVAMLHDPEFQKTLAARMAERRMDEYGTPQKIAQRLQTDFTIDSHRDGVLVYTLAGINKKEITAFLDILTLTLLTESNRQVTKRADNAMAVVPGERRDGTRVRYASVNDIPISDERMRYAMPIFGGLFILCVVVMVLAYSQLIKVKRVFDEETAQLFEQNQYDGE